MTRRPLGLTDEDSEKAIYLALGAASMCWEHPAGAGVFDSVRCAAIGAELVDYLRSRRLLAEPSEVR